MRVEESQESASFAHAHQLPGSPNALIMSRVWGRLGGATSSVRFVVVDGAFALDENPAQEAESYFEPC